MKINSKFGPKCPTCAKAITNPVWWCRWCRTPICEWCYSPHTEAVHPEKYAQTEA